MRSAITTAAAAAAAGMTGLRCDVGRWAPGDSARLDPDFASPPSPRQASRDGRSAAPSRRGEGFRVPATDRRLAAFSRPAEQALAALAEQSPLDRARLHLRPAESGCLALRPGVRCHVGHARSSLAAARALGNHRRRRVATASWRREQVTLRTSLSLTGKR